VTATEKVAKAAPIQTVAGKRGGLDGQQRRQIAGGGIADGDLAGRFRRRLRRR